MSFPGILLTDSYYSNNEGLELGDSSVVAECRKVVSDLGHRSMDGCGAGFSPVTEISRTSLHLFSCSHQFTPDQYFEKFD